MSKKTYDDTFKSALAKGASEEQAKRLAEAVARSWKRKT
jgi:hypothetical protein